MQNPKGAKARDEEKTRYREYLLRRLRVPAGVVFGHGLVDLAVIQGSEEVDSAVMQRLQANSLAELEHLFLEFYQELMVVSAVPTPSVLPLCCARKAASDVLIGTQVLIEVRFPIELAQCLPQEPRLRYASRIQY